jgi:trigger factor
MATVARENIGLLNDKITVKVSKEDYLPTFEKKLKEYSKTVNMPGFRKGMVPTGMIKKMYGPSIYTDEVLKTVEKQLYTYLDTEKPDIFAQPLALDADMRKLDLNNPADYEFGFEIGLKPTFKIAPLDKASVTFNKVKVTDKMVQDEVERMQSKTGKMAEQESIYSEECELTVLVTECDMEGNAVDGGIDRETAVTLKHLTPDAQQQFMFKKKDDSVVIQLLKAFDKVNLDAFVQDLVTGKDDVTWDEKYFKLKIEKIELLEKEDLNEEFFNKVFPGVAIATEEEFRQKLKEEIEQYWDSQSRVQLHDQLYHYLLDETNIEFPADFLKRWLQTGSEERKTAEQAEEEFPVFSNQLKWTLISDKVIRDNHLEVSLEEVKNSIRTEVMSYFGNMSNGSLGDDTGWLDSYVERMMKDEKQLDATYRRLQTGKIFKFAESLVIPVEKEVTSEELVGMQHHHHH